MGQDKRKANFKNNEMINKRKSSSFSKVSNKRYSLTWQEKRVERKKSIPEAENEWEVRSLPI